MWDHEARKGQEEGLKDRPVVVVLSATIEDNLTRITVAPVTHSQPPPGGGVPIPPAVKRHLGLDDEQSWIVTTEVNRFFWPGPDIRSAGSTGTPIYGAIPAKLFEQVKLQISANAKAGQAVIVPRTE